ncbi:serine/threonine protein kinase [Tolypothrix sp. PCC 7910]|uniref:serine/threonine protein kinase n=1 Tax=Tolypothrix sp. PCC 7910 TaxID=2099387 RepID=UPI0014278E17|nr:serine/threonine-protein kinase [Tolypothrix sp. PCC 7910]QIR39743.1 serine/threonine protein kinase [Tolypothrix sp. PCC 7910]
MASLNSFGDPEPQNFNDKEYCLCINPNCPSPKRNKDENRCQACGAALLLNEKYRVIDVLKESKNKACQLYNAVDITNSNKSQVLKFLYTHNPEALTRFNRGADFLINHRFAGLPKVHKGGYFHIDFPKNLTPAYALVMEKIDGKNLQEWLANKTNLPLSPQKAIQWLEQLVTILSKLHQQQFYHQDIKPSNIMLRNQPEELILIDLDSVTAIAQAAEGKDLTIIGTSGYQAPEQVDGNAVPQSDFYALGRTFVHLLTGTHPNNFSRDDLGVLYWRNSAKQVSKIFADLIDKLMEWDYQKRPQNTAEILRIIEEVKQDLERQKQVKQWLSFKKAVGIIVILSVAVLGYIAIKSPNRPPTPGNVPSPVATSTANPKCKIRKETGTADNSALAWDARQILQDYKVVNTQDLEFQQIQDLKVTQFNCDLNIYIRLVNNNVINPSLRNKITEIVKKNFDYVGTIRVIPAQ